VHRSREKRRKESETLLQSELKHLVKRHFQINTNRAVFPACYLCCVNVFVCIYML
jgi:hypothetical protein